MARAGRHVNLCLCRAVERGAAGTTEGVPAWRSGVCGLGALLTSSHVISGVSVGAYGIWSDAGAEYCIPGTARAG
jgi:hypothetical protein